MTLDLKAMAEQIVKVIFNESCFHADDGHCDMCLKEHLLDSIPKALKEVQEATREETVREAASLCATFAESEEADCSEKSETACILSNRIYSLLTPKPKETA